MSTSPRSHWLALLLALALVGCGDDSPGTGSGGTGGGGSSLPDAAALVDYCSMSTAGCMATSVSSEGIPIRSCAEIYSQGIPVPAEFEEECVNGDDIMRDYLPGGCPRDGDMVCGTVSRIPPAGVALVMLNFVYSTGNESFDSMLCTNCSDDFVCCEGPAFPR